MHTHRLATIMGIAIWQACSTARLAPLDGRAHLLEPIGLWQGDSVAASHPDQGAVYVLIE